MVLKAIASPSEHEPAPSVTFVPSRTAIWGPVRALRLGLYGKGGWGRITNLLIRPQISGQHNDTTFLLGCSQAANGCV